MVVAGVVTWSTLPSGLPPGGTVGQALTKIDDSDFNVHWATVAGGGADAYSTTETLTNKTWLGNAVYRKVVDLGALPNTTSKSVAHGITGATSWRAIYGLANGGSSIGFPLPYADATPANCVSLYTDGTNIHVAAGSDRSGYTGYAILEYTK